MRSSIASTCASVLGRVWVVGQVDLCRHDHGGVEIDRVFRLVAEMRGAILHLGDARRRVGFRPPVGVRQRLVSACAVEADQVRRARGLDAARPGQAVQRLLIILAGVPAHQTAQRSIGFLGRGIDADPPGGHQVVLARDLPDEAEYGMMDFQRQP
jgi:hypothetical protein